MSGKGLTSSTGPAAPPYTLGPYTWDQNLTMSGNLTVNGNLTFGDAVTDTLTVNGTLAVGAFGDASGIALTDDTLKAVEIYPELASAGTVLTGGNVAYGIRNRFLVNKAQTNNVSLYATQGQMRVKANLAAGVHAGLFGYFEQSGTVVLSSSGSFNTACNLAVEGSSGLTVDSGVNLAICVMTNNLNNGSTMNGNYYGLMIREGSGMETMKAGIIVSAPATSAPILVDGSSTALLANGEQAIYVNCPSETLATNGVWVTLKSTVTSGDLTGGRFKATTLRGTSGGPNVRGVYGQALSDTASKFAGLLQGGLFVASYVGASTTATNVYGVTGFISDGAGLTTSGNVAAVQAHLQTYGNENITGTHAGVLITNEAVGTTGSKMDAFISCGISSLSGGIHGADYLIDAGISANTIDTAFVRLPDDGTIVSVTNGSILNDISATTNAGFIKVLVGSNTRYIAVYEAKS